MINKAPTFYLLEPGEIEPDKCALPFTAPISAQAGRQRGQGYGVAYQPWQRPTRIVSLHRSARAAERCAAEARATFKRQNPNGYGHTWDAVRIEWAEQPENEGGGACA